MQKYIETVCVNIDGISALAGVTFYKEKKPAISPYLVDSDYDFYGYVEMDYDLLNEDGTPAPWLYSKVTPKIEKDIEHAINVYMHDANC